jgi:hypothetical protein
VSTERLWQSRCERMANPTADRFPVASESDLLASCASSATGAEVRPPGAAAHSTPRTARVQAGVDPHSRRDTLAHAGSRRQYSNEGPST